MPPSRPTRRPRATAPSRSERAPAPVHRVEVALRAGTLDPEGAHARARLLEAGLEGVEDVRVVRTFFLRAAPGAAPGARRRDPLDPEALERAAHEALANPVLDRFAVDAPVPCEPAGEGPLAEVRVDRRPGVTDPEAESARQVLANLGIPVAQVHRSRCFVVRGRSGPAALLAAARRTLGNEAIEEVALGRRTHWDFPRGTRAPIRRRTVPLRALGREALEAMSRRLGLALSGLEMEAVRDHFRALRREPTDVELETFAQTWSEHCKHKTLGGPVRMQDEAGERVYRNLLQETIFEATRRLARPWCWSVFRDNAGVIDLDGRHGVCMKVETHNHPSAIEPYGGAGTGIGGVIRDVLGTGLGARPVANTDVFCFGPPDLPPEAVPRGALHPRTLLRGVVAGVRDYGNRMGIPTVNGAICFDPRYVGNPVVYCGCVGVMPREAVEKGARPGDLIVAFGGRTGRDGVHGATFSSEALHSGSETVSSGAVQIGDPITEKKVRDVLLQGRDLGCFTSVTDCGAGGFSSAVGEMGEETGAEVDLSVVPLKYPGLEPWEIWVSEAQERMVAAVPPRRWPRLRDLCAREDVEAVVLGRFRDDGRLVVRHGRTALADLDMRFLHGGLPRVERRARWAPPPLPVPRVRRRARLDRDLLALLGTPQIGSKEWVIRQYDHEVQAGAVVRSLVGPGEGPSDGAVLAPLLGSNRGVVLACGIAPAFGDLDPHAMAMAVVDEAIRNAVCVGADPRRLALLDNFTWGDCGDPDVLGALVRAAEGCRDAALLFRTPFISGKDSLHNEFRTEDGTRIRVPHTLLVSAISVIADVRRTATADLKDVGGVLWAVGETHDECGGSRWFSLRGLEGGAVPRVARAAPRTMRAVADLVRGGLVRAAHDPSEGGLLVALAEMAFASPFGLDVDLLRAPRTAEDPQVVGFAESATRFLLEAPPGATPAIQARLAAARVPFARLGRVTRAPRLLVRWGRGAGGRTLVDLPTARLGEAWRQALGPGLGGGPSAARGREP